MIYPARSRDREGNPGRVVKWASKFSDSRITRSRLTDVFVRALRGGKSPEISCQWESGTRLRRLMVPDGYESLERRHAAAVTQQGLLYPVKQRDYFDIVKQRGLPWSVPQQRLLWSSGDSRILWNSGDYFDQCHSRDYFELWNSGDCFDKWHSGDYFALWNSGDFFDQWNRGIILITDTAGITLILCG